MASISQFAVLNCFVSGDCRTGSVDSRLEGRKEGEISGKVKLRGVCGGAYKNEMWR